MTPPFPLPVLFTAWTWKDGAGIAGEVIRRAKLMGARSVAVQLSQATGDDPGSSLDPQDVKFLKDAGLTVVGWDPAGDLTQTLLVRLGVDAWCPQVEGPGQRDALLASLNAGVGKGLPRALVTTYGGLDTTADVQALVKAWGGQPFTLVECYKADGPIHADIDRMLSQGVVYGFQTLLALAGCYRGEMPADYPTLRPTNYGGLYLEENATDAQLKAFSALASAPTPAPTPEPTVTNDAAERNKKIAAIADEWLATFGPAELSRLGCITDIAKSGDTWTLARRQDVRDALTGAVAALRAELQAERQARVEATSKLNEALAKIAAAQAALK